MYNLLGPLINYDKFIAVSVSEITTVLLRNDTCVPKFTRVGINKIATPPMWSIQFFPWGRSEVGWLSWIFVMVGWSSFLSFPGGLTLSLRLFEEVEPLNPRIDHTAPLFWQQIFYDPHPQYTSPLKQTKVLLKSSLLKQNKHIVLILWLPTFWSSKILQPLTYFFLSKQKIMIPLLYFVLSLLKKTALKSINITTFGCFTSK